MALLSLLPWNVSPLTHSRLFTRYAEEDEEEKEEEKVEDTEKDKNDDRMKPLCD